jgi:hypothetical protein
LEQPPNIFGMKRHSDQGGYTPASRHEELPLLHGKFTDNSHALQCLGTNTKLSTTVRGH